MQSSKKRIIILSKDKFILDGQKEAEWDEIKKEIVGDYFEQIK